MKTILFFGDSLTAGYGLSNPGEESFTARIAEKLNKENFNYTIINAGISGDSSSSGLARLDYWLSTTIDVFVLELGINDIIRGLPPSSTKVNLDKILKRVRQKYPACKIAIMGMDPPNLKGAGRIQESNSMKTIEEFKLIYRDLAESYQAARVPFFLQGVAGVARLNLQDGLHPNREGYKVIAENAWPVIKSLL